MVLIPYNTSMTNVPIKMTPSTGTNANFGNMYLDFGSGFNLAASTLNLLTVSPAQQGYAQWLVIATNGSIGTQNGLKIRIYPENFSGTIT